MYDFSSLHLSFSALKSNWFKVKIEEEFCIIQVPFRGFLVGDTLSFDAPCEGLLLSLSVLRVCPLLMWVVLLQLLISSYGLYSISSSRSRTLQTDHLSLHRRILWWLWHPWSYVRTRHQSPLLLIWSRPSVVLGLSIYRLSQGFATLKDCIQERECPTLVW